LQQRGAAVEYHDPHVPSLKLESGDMVSADLTADRLRDADLVLIATDHTAVDYDLVGRHATLVVDPRNVIGEVEKAVVYPIAGPPRSSVVRRGYPVDD
ncbi:MAG: hypothetical protein KJO06_05195, partial [Gemmatimonadetes bacterium]|nr:hypothetical protein [Gemmatimonadota bacterium]